MMKSLRGTEAQSTQEEKQVPPEDIKQLLNSHHEVLVIAVDPDPNQDPNAESEFKIASFTKMLDKESVLAPFLTDLLRNLLASNNGKQRGGVSNKTPISA